MGILLILSINLLQFIMDLSLLKDYFEACDQAEDQLQQYWHQFLRVPAFALFRCIATKSQPALDANLIRQYLLTFNWQTIYIDSTQVVQPSKFKIHQTQSQIQPLDLLDHGIQLLLSQWSANKSMTYDQFSMFVKGEHEAPNSKDRQVSYPQKKLLCQCLLHEMKNLIRFQSLKKIVYHQYKNLSDLFETVTNTRLIQYENIQRLFLSFSQRKSEKAIQRICKRAKIPWDFNYFMNLFKRKDTQQNQFKIHYSSKRIKDFQSQNSKAFTTPRKQKFAVNQTSTKVTKKYRDQSLAGTPKLITLQQIRSQVQPHTYIQILADLLQIQQKFNDLCSRLVKRKDFDLQLVYQRHGKKFECILNQRYGVCNFSAFVRFIVPRDYQHRYLSFIRYQPDDTLTGETQSAINSLISQYYNKQNKIQQLWKRCDKQMFLRLFCLPKQQCIRPQKLNEIFSTREVKVLLQRLDPHKKDKILLQALC